MLQVFQHRDLVDLLKVMLNNPSQYVLLNCVQGYHRTPAVCMLLWIYLYVFWLIKVCLGQIQWLLLTEASSNAKVCGSLPILWIPSCTKKWASNENWKDELETAAFFHKDVQRSRPDQWPRRKSLFQCRSEKVQTGLRLK